jgi:NAD dependent epimerase/dehydratase family enzyme
VLGTEGGLLRALRVPFGLGLGGCFGTGAQWMSWIARDDLARLIAHAIATPELTGPVNATAPEPVRNAVFTQALGEALRRRAPLRYPAALLRLVAGDLAGELMLAGQRVLPAKVEASGFEFRYPTLAGALASLFDSAPLTQARAALPELETPAACLTGENAATTSPSLASVAAPALEDCVGDAARDVELARRPG